MVKERKRLQGFDDIFRLLPYGYCDQVHLAALGLISLPIGGAAVGVNVLKCVDAILFALAQRFAHAFRRVPISHHAIERAVEVRIPIELIAADDQPADFRFAESNLRQLNAARLRP